MLVDAGAIPSGLDPPSPGRKMISTAPKALTVQKNQPIKTIERAIANKKLKGSFMYFNSV
jgi:hypothetical protein